jgi:hypothetical protein
MGWISRVAKGGAPLMRRFATVSKPALPLLVEGRDIGGHAYTYNEDGESAIGSGNPYNRPSVAVVRSGQLKKLKIASFFAGGLEVLFSDKRKPAEQLVEFQKKTEAGIIWFEGDLTPAELFEAADIDMGDNVLVGGVGAMSLAPAFKMAINGPPLSSILKGQHDNPNVVGNTSQLLYEVLFRRYGLNIHPVLHEGYKEGDFIEGKLIGASLRHGSLVGPVSMGGNIVHLSLPPSDGEVQQFMVLNMLKQFAFAGLADAKALVLEGGSQSFIDLIRRAAPLVPKSLVERSSEHPFHFVPFGQEAVIDGDGVLYSSFRKSMTVEQVRNSFIRPSWSKHVEEKKFAQGKQNCLDM